MCGCKYGLDVFRLGRRELAGGHIQQQLKRKSSSIPTLIFVAPFTVVSKFLDDIIEVAPPSKL